MSCPKKKFWTKQKTIKLNGRSLLVDNIREGRTANKRSGKKRCGRSGNDGWWSRRRKLIINDTLLIVQSTGTCFIQTIYAPSSSLLQSKHLPFSSSALRLNIFRLFVILSLTQLYRYTPEIFLLSTATFKYTYWAPLRRIGQEYSANVAFST